MNLGSGAVELVDSKADPISLMTSFFGLTHTASFIVDKRVGEVFSTSGNNRAVQSQDIQSGSIDVLDVSLDFTESVLSRLLSTTSKFLSYEKRESLIIFFFSTGVATKHSNIFTLDISVPDPIGKENEGINVKSMNYQNYLVKNLIATMDNYYKFLQELLDLDVYTDIRGNHERVLQTSSTGNVYQLISRLQTTAGRSLSYAEEQSLRIYTREFRKGINEFTSPSFENTCKFFGIGENQARRLSREGIGTLVKEYPDVFDFGGQV